MHIVSLGALGGPRAIAVAWWVNGGQLEISVHMCHQQHLMKIRDSYGTVINCMEGRPTMVSPECVIFV